ncbi:MAG: hypothetical protein S4CHLAM27_09830 [Chlamydiia bacterium]|nr:hypothetical protein [Chlamydiia bacterium]
MGNPVQTSPASFTANLFQNSYLQAAGKHTTTLFTSTLPSFAKSRAGKVSGVALFVIAACIILYRNRPTTNSIPSTTTTPPSSPSGNMQAKKTPIASTTNNATTANTTTASRPTLDQQTLTAIVDTNRFFSPALDAPRAMIAPSQEQVEKGTKGGGGGGGKDEDEVTVPLKPFEIWRIEARCANLQNMFIEAYNGKKDKIIPNIFSQVSQGNEQLLLNNGSLNNLFLEKGGKVNIYNSVILPFLEELKIIEDTSEYNRTKWNAFIHKNCEKWTDNQTLSLGEFLYFLHEAKVMSLLTNQITHTLPEELAKEEKQIYQLANTNLHNLKKEEITAMVAQIKNVKALKSFDTALVPMIHFSDREKAQSIILTAKNDLLRANLHFQTTMNTLKLKADQKTFTLANVNPEDLPTPVQQAGATLVHGWETLINALSSKKQQTPEMEATESTESTADKL